MTKILVIVGPSGSGKTTLAGMLAQNDVAKVVTTTTRAPRNGEVDGVDYNFLSKPDFIARIENDEFVEHAEYGGSLYGCRKSDVADAVAKSKKNGASAVSIVCEIAGLFSMRNAFAGRVQCLFMAPDEQKIAARLRDRGMTVADLEHRLKAIREEADNIRHLQSGDRVIGDCSLEELADIAAEIAC